MESTRPTKPRETPVVGTPASEDAVLELTPVSAVPGKHVAQISEKAPQFPDGGLRAWLVVFGAWLVQFSNYGYTNAFGVYNDYYVREYLNEHSSSQISWIGSVQISISIFIGLYAGRAFDAGYFNQLMLFGSVLSVFSLFMLSLAQPHHYYQVFLSQGIGLGLAIGITYVPSVSVISHYFLRKRALALGIATTGAALGGLIHPILLNQLIYSRLGFRGAVKVSAGLDGVMLLVAFLLMRPQYPAAQSTSVSRISFWKALKTYYAEPPFLLTSLGVFFGALGVFFPVFFLQLNTVERGISSTLAFYTLAIMNGAGFFGRIIPTMLVPRLGVFNLVIFTTLCCGILIFSLQGVTNAAGTVMVSLLYGFFLGAYSGLAVPMMASLASNHSEIGARIGVCYTFTGISSLVGTPIAGALLGAEFHWIRPISFAATAVLVASCFFAAARFGLARLKTSYWV